MVVRSKKRRCVAPAPSALKRRRIDPFADETGAKLKNRHLNRRSTAGIVLTLGVGDTGQLGLGPDITERLKPARFSAASLSNGCLNDDVESFVQVVAGGMHTVCLTADGRVFTFGCNDEGALGRQSTDTSLQDTDGKSVDGLVEESRPGVVTFPEKDVHIIMISAGDSHTAALDNLGRVWLWGTFRGSGGAIGLTKEGEICRCPIRLETLLSVVVKIASGQDHLVCLTEEGRLLTMGCGEQGQLGRIAERFSKDGGRNGFDLLLQPGECRVRGCKRFVDVWAGGFATIARCMNSGVIYACGLNNYGQLALVKKRSVEVKKRMEIGGNTLAGTEDFVKSEQVSESMLTKRQGPLVQFMLTPANGFDPEKNWVQFAIGMHHTLALTSSGEVYAVGRSDYGRLGFTVSKSDSDVSAVPSPHVVQGPLLGRKCCWIGCGEACSFAIDDAGKAFSWGMGSSQQLAHEVEYEDAPEPGEMVGKNLLNRRVVMVDAGGQHAVMLAADPSRVKPRATKLDTEEASGKIAPPKDEKSVVTNNHTPSAPMDTTSEVAVSVTNEKNSSDKPLVNSLSGSNLPPEVASTAGATVNSSSVHSCSFVASDQSSLSSAHSTDGGGSSRLGGSLFAQPVDAPLASKAGVAPAAGVNCGGSTTSTSEPSFPLTDGGSNTASPANTH
ncbi:Regulator of chromosome condensation [Echinococcus granulosus]|uniref:Regulator of chromosome condensation n=1 Tax=Echinococcus granulosus TaxID=6210 RepID=U6JBX9_ECHGR|nr:Regulator of chromosome condensation [Echinococcus granulosus]EUB62732.1 Regulator of chromosome condensation [Echinococcus granulosus]KAH9280222.1 Regulator of chromosome condensation [Echinococcus granulosus]CDS19249.1 regulator of chromosome condensation [Echinococcus granulosus]